jgi:hypothetical protein
MSEPSPFRRMQERAMARLEPLVTVPMTQQAREDLGNAATGLAITAGPCLPGTKLPLSVALTNLWLLSQLGIAVAPDELDAFAAEMCKPGH